MSRDCERKKRRNKWCHWGYAEDQRSWICRENIQKWSSTIHACSKTLRRLPRCWQFMESYYLSLQRKRHPWWLVQTPCWEEGKWLERAHMWQTGKSAFFLEYISKTRWPVLTQFAVVHFSRSTWNKSCRHKTDTWFIVAAPPRRKLRTCSKILWALE